MICPYIRKTELTTTVEKTNPDEETGVFTMRVTNMKTEIEMANCVTCSCPKWRDDKCTM